MHALVIEDDAIVAMMIEDELLNLGFSSIEIATTQDEAIEAAMRRRPDLVTSDGTLSAGSGPGAVRQIRASFMVPVIFITGDPEPARHCVPGALVIEKPFSTTELASAIEQVRST